MRRPFSLEMFITLIGIKITYNYYPTETRFHSVVAHSGTYNCGKRSLYELISTCFQTTEESF